MSTKKEVEKFQGQLKARDASKKWQVIIEKWKK